MRPIVYGIANCDTVKRSRAWLAEHGVDAAFHDFKKSGAPVDRLPAWLETFGWEQLLNRKGTTWRALDEASRAKLVDAASAVALMLAHPSVIKRPVIEWNRQLITLGFVPEAWQRIAAAPAASA